MNAIANPPAIGFEKSGFRIFQFFSKVLQMSSLRHISGMCKNSCICPVCGEEGHSSSKDDPCSRPLKCALYKSTDDPCYQTVRGNEL